MNEFIVFVIGAFGYSVIEMLWRGFTHWAMAIAGGVCFLVIYSVNLKLKYPLLVKAFFSAIMITAVELLFGLVFNTALGFEIWDYSALPMNFMGQICLFYSIMWFFLSIPLIKLCDILKVTLESA